MNRDPSVAMASFLFCMGQIFVLRQAHEEGAQFKGPKDNVPRGGVIPNGSLFAVVDDLLAAAANG